MVGGADCVCLVKFSFRGPLWQCAAANRSFLALLNVCTCVCVLARVCKSKIAIQGLFYEVIGDKPSLCPPKKKLALNPKTPKPPPNEGEFMQHHHLWC